MMPTSQQPQHKKRKLLSSSWWRKVLLFKSKVKGEQKQQAQKTSNNTQNWRNLSPDEPPLPFLLNNPTVPSIKFTSSSEAGKYSSELAPIFSKDASLIDHFPSPSLYISQPSSSSRDLYTIPELSEMNTTTTTTTRSNSTANNTIKSNQSSVIISSSTVSAIPPPPPLPTLSVPSEEELQQHVTHNNDECVSQPSSSSFLDIISATQEEKGQHRHHSMVLIEDDDDEEAEEEKEDEEEDDEFKPISEWPSLDTGKRKEPQFKKSLQGNEVECKVIFSHMLQSAHKHHQLLYRKRTNAATTKEMHLIFDEKGNIAGITFILNNGRREDYLQFGGTPQYIPPELSLCATYNHEMADVWALGISLYRMLVGNYPFPTNCSSHQELFKKMLHSDFRIPHTLSEDAKDLLRRMLAPESTRASLDLILFHPWIRSCVNTSPYIPEQVPPPQQLRTAPLVVEEKRRKGKKRIVGVLKKAIRLIFLGPVHINIVMKIKLDYCLDNESLLHTCNKNSK